MSLGFLSYGQLEFYRFRRGAAHSAGPSMLRHYDLLTDRMLY